MRRIRVAGAATASLLAAAVALSLTTPQAGAQPTGSAPTASSDQTIKRSDDRVPAWRAKYDKIRQEAVQKRLRHRRQGLGRTSRPRDSTARSPRLGKDRIFVVLTEFGDTRHSVFPDDPESGAQRFDGPLHNEIPKPNRKVDNSTMWDSNFDRKYFENMYFNRMADFYTEQSSGQYTVDGDVTSWVKVPFNQARYGSNNGCSAGDCGVGFLLRDALAQWTQDRLDAGWTMDRIQTYLKTFDNQDRYDFDEDGDFAEPDGYIDHFQIVHAGGDEADGDPIYGADAIWSHRGNVRHPRPRRGPRPRDRRRADR